MWLNEFGERRKTVETILTNQGLGLLGVRVV